MYEFNSRDLDTDRPVDVSRRRPGVRQLALPRDSALIQAYRSPDYILKGWNPDE